jgi:glycyl-tRNA synthetase
LGVVQILLDRRLSLDLRGAVALVAQAQPVEVTLDHQEAVVNFIAGRLEVLLLEQGEQNDVVKAVLAEQAHNPARVVAAIRQLTKWVRRQDWSPILDAYARCVRITRDLEDVYEIKPDLFHLSAEKALYGAYLTISNSLKADYNIGDFLAAFEMAVPAITHFFEDVMVMDENPAIRENRLALLQALTGLANGRADLSYLVGF